MLVQLISKSAQIMWLEISFTFTQSPCWLLTPEQKHERELQKKTAGCNSAHLIYPTGNGWDEQSYTIHQPSCSQCRSAAWLRLSMMWRIRTTGPGAELDTHPHLVLRRRRTSTHLLFVFLSPLHGHQEKDSIPTRRQSQILSPAQLICACKRPDRWQRRGQRGTMELLKWVQSQLLARGLDTATEMLICLWWKKQKTCHLHLFITSATRTGSEGSVMLHHMIKSGEQKCSLFQEKWRKKHLFTEVLIKLPFQIFETWWFYIRLNCLHLHDFNCTMK